MQGEQLPCTPNPQLKEGNNMSIIIKAISWFYVIAGFILIVVSVSTTDDVDLVYVGALGIVGIAVAAFGTYLLHKYD